MTNCSSTISIRAIVKYFIYKVIKTIVLRNYLDFCDDVIAYGNLVDSMRLTTIQIFVNNHIK